MYDATLKIWVEGFKAFSKGRFIGDTGEYTIWGEGAEKVLGKAMTVINHIKIIKYGEGKNLHQWGDFAP